MRTLLLIFDEGDRLQPTLLVAETSDQLREGIFSRMKKGHTAIVGTDGYELDGKRKFLFRKMFSDEQTKEEIAEFPWDKGEIGIEVR